MVVTATSLRVEREEGWKPLPLSQGIGVSHWLTLFYLILLFYKVLVISGGPKVVTVTVHSKFSLVLVVMDVHKVFVG